jgi:hypothetical protein
MASEEEFEGGHGRERKFLSELGGFLFLHLLSICLNFGLLPKESGRIAVAPMSAS